MHAYPMTSSADTATTHVGWRQSSSDADADHLLIRSDWGPAQSNPADEPVLRFLGDEAADTNPAAKSSSDVAELDAEVNDAAVDAPPYLWGGEALASDSVSGPSETVFS